MLTFQPGQYPALSKYLSRAFSSSTMKPVRLFQESVQQRPDQHSKHIFPCLWLCSVLPAANTSIRSSIWSFCNGFGRGHCCVQHVLLWCRYLLHAICHIPYICKPQPRHTPNWQPSGLCEISQPLFSPCSNSTLGWHRYPHVGFDNSLCLLWLLLQRDSSEDILVHGINSSRRLHLCNPHSQLSGSKVSCLSHDYVCEPWIVVCYSYHRQHHCVRVGNAAEAHES